MPFKDPFKNLTAVKLFVSFYGFIQCVDVILCFAFRYWKTNDIRTISWHFFCHLLNGYLKKKQQTLLLSLYIKIKVSFTRVAFILCFFFYYFFSSTHRIQAYFCFCYLHHWTLKRNKYIPRTNPDRVGWYEALYGRY